jgi:hypothetical protein
MPCEEPAVEPVAKAKVGGNLEIRAQVGFTRIPWVARIKLVPQGRGRGRGSGREKPIALEQSTDIADGKGAN